MRLSGVDPGIIRELSGIYKPFVKAFKELISNAYDADAKRIEVFLHPDFSALDVLDDGGGMTPYEFHQDFARLGGSTAWLRGGKSPGGRPRIGYKGIGFLAVARYCSALHVETYAERPYRSTQVLLRRNRKTLPLTEIVGEVVPLDLLEGRFHLRTLEAGTNGKLVALKPSKDYAVGDEGIRLLSPRALAATDISIDFEIDCSHLLLEAVLDFDYLLGLERRADLRLLENFCSVSLKRAPSRTRPHTKVSLRKLKDFVVRDLSSPAVKGKARNIVFKSGKEQFLWRLARSAPIRDDVSGDARPEAIRRSVKVQSGADLPDLILKWRDDEPVQLLRPVYLAKGQPTPLEETIIPVELDEKGLKVSGYILARSEVIYPAECRGLSIRVRNVAIGDASFLGWEHILSGPRKAAMSQITGELIVHRGLDASDAINPGRESFYEENAHYRTLRQALFGSEESIGGLVGMAIRSILDRIHVRSQVTDRLAEARARRKTLVDISSAVNFYSRSGGDMSKGLKAFFAQPVKADGLSGARDVPLRPTHKLAGFELVQEDGLSTEAEIDYQARRIRMDFSKDAWNTTVYLDGHYYDVAIKQGKPDHPICEFDNDRRRIYVNWGHPVKLHMADASFLKSAILLRLAHHAAADNADTMMDLALNMLAFRAE
jgi:hypothetical protein